MAKIKACCCYHLCNMTWLDLTNIIRIFCYAVQSNLLSSVMKDMKLTTCQIMYTFSWKKEVASVWHQLNYCPFLCHTSNISLFCCYDCACSVYTICVFTLQFTPEQIEGKDVRLLRIKKVTLYSYQLDAIVYLKKLQDFIDFWNYYAFLTAISRCLGTIYTLLPACITVLGCWMIYMLWPRLFVWIYNVQSVIFVARMF